MNPATNGNGTNRAEFAAPTAPSTICAMPAITTVAPAIATIGPAPCVEGASVRIRRERRDEAREDERGRGARSAAGMGGAAEQAGDEVAPDRGRESRVEADLVVGGPERREREQPERKGDGEVPAGGDETAREVAAQARRNRRDGCGERPVLGRCALGHRGGRVPGRGALGVRRGDRVHSPKLRSPGRSRTTTWPYSIRSSPAMGERLQRLVHPLARHAREVADLLLRDREVGARTGVEIGVVHRREAARDAGVDVEQPVVLDLADELGEPLVELEEQEPVERDAGVEQLVERRARHHGDPGLAQRDHVVPAGLALQQRAFTEPGAGRQAGERRELAGPGQTRHLDQALDDADPMRDRLSLPANVVPGRHAALDRRGKDAVDPVGRERPCPEASPEHRFERVDRARRRRLSAG